MDIQSNQTLIEQLRKIIQLPKSITSLDLRMRMNEAPTLTLTTHVEGTHGHQVTQTFNLVANDWLEQRANEASAQVATWFKDLRLRYC